MKLNYNDIKVHSSTKLWEIFPWKSLIKDLDTVVEKFKNFGLKDNNPYSGQ